MRFPRVAIAIVATAATVSLLAVACGTEAPSAGTPTPTGPAAPQGSIDEPLPTSTHTLATPTPTPGPAGTPTLELAAGGVALVIGEGSTARYLVREQLAGLNLPNDAIGETPDVSGVVVFGPDGTVQPERSQLLVNLQTLRSDESRRDRYLRSNSLESSRFPQAEFAVREAPGLEWPLPTGGEGSFQLVGDMTVHGVTKPLTWVVTARFAEGSAVGLAKTEFTFGEFDMAVPRLFFILSVDDHIRLELDFVASIVTGS